VVDTDLTGRGKWSDPGVPHRGWECSGVDDLGEDPVNWQTCEMCESQEIRYVHTMVHIDYPSWLECGCVCAGNMEGSVNHARARERRYKAGAKRRSDRLIAWSNPATWNRSQRGNYWRKDHGYVATLFQQGPQWKWVISNDHNDFKRFSPHGYAKGEDAARAACESFMEFHR
jgi:hypothetical protein